MSPVKSSMYTEFNVHSTLNTPWVGMAMMSRPIVPKESWSALSLYMSSPAILFFTQIFDTAHDMAARMMSISPMNI